MAAYAPHAFLAGQALGSAGDPHLRDGLHLRLVHSPMIGLPLAPYLVRRAVGPPESFPLRTDVVWVRESDGVRLTPPFDIPTGDAAIGWFVPGETGGPVWVEVAAEPARIRFPGLDLTELLKAHLRRIVGSGGAGAGGGGPRIEGLDVARRTELLRRVRGGTSIDLGGFDPDVLRRRGRGLGGGVGGGLGRAGGAGGRPVERFTSAEIERLVERTIELDDDVEDDEVAAVREVADDTVVRLDPQHAEVLRRANPASSELIDALGRIRFRDLWWLRRATVRVEARINSPGGPVPVATRSRAPYAVGASHIHHVRVTGRGVVEAARWLPRLDQQRPLGEVTHVDHRRRAVGPKPWQLLGYPIDEVLPRYAGMPGLEQAARERVERGAPLRLGLHDATTASPGTAPTTSQADELARVDALYGHDLERQLRVALEDTSAAQAELTETHDGQPVGGGSRQGDITFGLVDQVVQAGLDHGVARMLGQLAIDRDEHPPGHLVVYEVLGIFDAPLDWLREEGYGALLGQDATVSWDDVLTAYGQDSAVKELAQIHRPQGRLVGLGLRLAALSREPHDRPLAPTIVGADDGRIRDGRTEWRDAEPDDLRRVRIDLDRLYPAAALGVRRTVDTSTTAMNRPSPAAGRRALEAGQPNGAGPRSRTVEDPSAPGDAAEYGVAQVDWHGRWSGWSGADVPEGQRPAPPRPAIAGEYRPAPVTRPVADSDTAPVSGEVGYELPVPRGPQLPPGGVAIAQLRLELTIVDDARSVLSTVSDTTSAVPATGDIRDALTGPPLARSSGADVRLRGRFVDVDGRQSDWSDPVFLRAVDLRPPVQVTFPPELRYGARPDVRDRSRIDLAWTPVAGQDQFAVYASDEGAVRQVLEADTGTDHTALLAALDAAGDDLPARAGVWRDNRAALPLGAFTLVTARPIPAATPQTSYSHEVSGTLRTLSLVRIVAVSEDNVPADFATSPLVTAAVPVSLPPPQPIVTATARTDGNVDVSIDVPAGATPAVRYRLRRSSVASGDPLSMPVVHEGVFPLPTPPPLVDTGGAMFGEPATIPPWTRLSYVAEVRGPTLPGEAAGTRPRVEPAWSRPSQPVSVATIPPQAPTAPTQVTVVRTASGAELTVCTSVELRGGELGAYTLEVYLARGESRMGLVGARSIEGRTTATASGEHEHTVTVTTDPADPAIPERWSVLVRDPLGRTSTPTLAT